MSIGVSYTGHDGRRAEFSVQDAQDAAARMSGLSGRSMQESMNDAQGLLAAVRKNGAARPAQQAQKPSREKVMAGGSVVRNAEGSLCLSGEEISPLIPGIKMFGAHNGSKGFFSFDEMDPPVHGAVVGRGVGDENQSRDANDARKDIPDGTAWAERVQTDTQAEQDPSTGLITFYKYFRLNFYSALGRVIGCSAEWREVLFAFVPGGAGGGRWEVRPVKNASGHVTEFLFGASGDLGSESDNVSEIREKETVTSVKVLTCPGGA